MKIEFKRIAKVDLTKVFPVIDSSDYKLLSGQSLIIQDQEWKSIQKKGYLQVGPYQISKDLIDIAAGESNDPIQNKIKEEVSKKAIHSNDMVDIMFQSVKLGKNLLQYGRGGHNKSEGTVMILEMMRKEGLITEQPFIMALGDGLTEETLLGGINIKKFKDDGELVYLLNSPAFFGNHEVVILEEIFDAPPQVLLTLKDILSSGEVRKGNQRHKIKTKLVIGLTNRSKEEFAEDDSLEALTQRFPLTLKVEWPSYSTSDWQKLFKVVFDSDFNDQYKNKLRELAEILNQNNSTGTSFCSPRTAVHAAKLYCNGGDLRYISDIDQQVVKDYFKANKDSEQETADNNMFSIIDEYIKANKIEGLDLDAELLAILLDEQEKRTGEKLEIEADPDKGVKVNKLEYAVALMNMHSFSAKNRDRSIKKIQEIKEMISQLKK
jgi:hypothetical protein